MKPAHLLLSALALLIATPALAWMPTQSGQEFPWQDEKVFQSCGQVCLLHKANETLSLQAVYILRKIAALQKDSSRVKTELAGYCDTVTTPAESDGDCLKRYIRSQISYLSDIRAAIIQNASHAEELRSTVKMYDVYGNEVARAPLPKPVFESHYDDGKAPQVPYVATIDDLRRDYGKLARQAAPEAIRYTERVTEAPEMQRFDAPPSIDQFVKFKEISRDPGNPAAGTFLVAQTDALGRPVPDLVRYKAAMDEWKKTVPSGTDTEGQIAADDRKVFRQNELKRGGIVRAIAFDQDLSPDLRKAYNEARGLVVASARNALVAGGVTAGRFAPTLAFGAAGARATDSRMPASLVDGSDPSAQLGTVTGYENPPPAAVVPGSRESYFTVTLGPQEIDRAIQNLKGDAY
jgi:hypothetical protein